MNLRFLEAFYWIAKLGSFSAAAARLHATPAAISERIRTLEEDLGVRVFERDSRKVSLTPQGQRLLPYAEQMLHVLGAEPLLQNSAPGYAPQPDYRPLTKFENRGLRPGHGVWDLVFLRRP